MKKATRMQYMKRTEASEQEAVIQICTLMERKHPELKLLYHCPNGGSRNRIEAANLKRQGVKAGVPDLHLPVPKGIYAGLFIEMKYGNGRLQETQKKWLQLVAEHKNFAVTCYGQELALEVIGEYLNLEPGQQMSIKNNTVLKQKSNVR